MTMILQGNKSIIIQFECKQMIYEYNNLSGTTPRTPNQERKGSVKTPRGGPVSDEEIEENLSYVEESSKVNILN